MRILFIAEHYKHNIQGGGEINLFSLCEALVESGHDVSVLTSYDSEKKKEMMNGVMVYQTVKTGNVTGLFGNVTRLFSFPSSVAGEVDKLLRKKHFDIIHLIGSALIVAYSLRRCGISVVATVESYIALCPKGDYICGNSIALSHWGFFRFVKCVLQSDEIGKVRNVWYVKYNPLFFGLVYYRFLRMNQGLHYAKLIAISSFVQKRLRSYNLRSVVIPNFVDCDKFKHPIKKNLHRYYKKRLSPKIKILYLGSLTRYKGIHVLLKAVCGLDCHVDVYGSGMLKRNLERYSDLNNLDVMFHAPVDYSVVPLLYQNADIVVFPSLWPEPFGRIAIEAMASGTIVVGSRVGGIAETIESGVGMLVEPGNIVELRDVLKTLIYDKRKRLRMGKKGRQVVQFKYDKSVVLRKLVQFYMRVKK
jgi:glycosyltransferase involved in cell wall biosynthesis